MKIIEALKELPLIDKKVNKKLEAIQKYSSAIDNGAIDLPFETVEKQKQEVASLVQAVNDLVKRKAEIKKRLAVTNATVNVTIDGVTNSITEWISLRDGGISHLITAQSRMNDSAASEKMSVTQFEPVTGLRVVRFYDEKARNAEIDKWNQIKDKINASLEMVNATTDMAA